MSVRHGADHIGYLTTVSYPDRDISAFTEGSPYSEIVISDLSGHHVALLQRFKAHWLIHVGTRYDTANVPGALSDRHALALAVFALRYRDRSPQTLLNALKAHVEHMLR